MNKDGEIVVTSNDFFNNYNHIKLTVSAKKQLLSNLTFLIVHFCKQYYTYQLSDIVLDADDQECISIDVANDIVYFIPVPKFRLKFLCIRKAPTYFLVYDMVQI